MSILDEAKATIKERLNSPFFGSLIIAFIACNWKAILLIFYPEKEWMIRDRLRWIAENIYNDGSERSLLWIWPIVIAILYGTIVPFILNLFDYMGYWAKVQRIKWRNNLSKDLPETVKMVADLTLKNEQLQAQSIKTENELKETKEELQRKSLWLAQTFETVVKTNSEIKKVLVKLHNHGGSLKVDESVHVKLLMDLKLIDKLSTGTHRLTPAGIGVAETLSA